MYPRHNQQLPMQSVHITTNVVNSNSELPLNYMHFSISGNRFDAGVMVSVLASSVVDRVFESRSGQTKDYEIGICFLFEYANKQITYHFWLCTLS
jgi:hypothetical protein